MTRVLTIVGVLFACQIDVLTAECAGGSDTITTEGCGCDPYDLCVGYSSEASCSGSGCVTDGDCTYECLAVDETATTLAVLVTFGDYESSEEVAARAAGSYDDAKLDSYTDTTSSWPSVSNNQVTTIGTVSLSSPVTTFMISGGNSTMEYPKSKVANITLEGTLVSTDTAVTYVLLHNLNLENQVDALPNLLPSSVTLLNIGNDLIKSFPTVLKSLSNLQQLYMDMNYVTSVNSSEVIESINYLSIQQNNLNSFTALFPNLQYLYLNDNNLTGIPDVVYEHDKLTELYLSGNTFPSLRFTQSEIDFLQNLTVLGLEMDDFSVSLHCDKDKEVVVHDLTVCLTEETSTTSTDSSSSGGASTSSSSSSSVSVGAIVGIIVAVVAVVAVVIGLIMYRRRQKKNSRDKLTGTNNDYHAGSTKSGFSMGLPTNGTDSGVLRSVWTDPDLLSLQVRAEDIEDIRQLGSGAYATVWLVRYRDSQLLASKRLRPDQRSKQRTSAFIEEIKLVATFDHPNLVKFIGAAWTIESDLQALLEYMEGGDLRDYLASPNTPQIWTSEKFGIAVGVIEALVYLHSFIPPLVHRDLKSRNVLLSSELQAKLSDFGTSRFRSEENTMTAGVGTGRWLAPEVITGEGNYGPAADIYSFGVLLTELDTHEIPYSDAVGTNGHGLSDMAILHQVATAMLRPNVSETCAPKLRELVDRCLDHDPSARPAATLIAYELRRMEPEIVAL